MIKTKKKKTVQVLFENTRHLLAKSMQEEDLHLVKSMKESAKMPQNT